MKKQEVIKYLNNKINYLTKKYTETGNSEYLSESQYLKNAILVLKGE